MNTVQKKWLIKKQPNIVSVERLKKELNTHEVIAYMLVQRGIESFEEARTFFRGTLNQLHSPFLMQDMDNAVQRINNALATNEKIMIYGDYDVDGTTAVSMMYQFLSSYSSNLQYYIPDRYEEGYGVSEKGIETAHEHDVSLIITLDCGIKAIEKSRLAQSRGIDMIICDHHTPGDELPDAIVLNPKRKDCVYPYKGLSGCGVGFKLLQALTETNGWDKEELFVHLDLLAISIGADIVPVTGENRILAMHGLKQINEGKIQRLGIELVLQKAKKEKPLTLTDVVFVIAPRINAAGRLGDAKLAVQLLIEQDKEKAKNLATQIHALNENRRELDATITEEALSLIQSDSSYSSKCTTVVYHKEWHKGVIGIVASRLIEQHYRPTIVLTQSKKNNKWTGSARSIKGINIYDVLEKCSSSIEQFGGHAAAAGMTIKEENLKRFTQEFDNAVRSIIHDELLIPEQLIEKELPFNELFSISETTTEIPRLMRILNQFEPYGPGNMRPLFLAHNCFAHEPRLLKEKHLKMRVFQPGHNKYIDAIYFNAPQAYEIVKSGSFDMVFTLTENQFRGRSTPQLMVKDLRPLNW